MNRELTSITVEIPAGTEQAFNKLVAAWIEGTASYPALAEHAQVVAPEGDELLERAVAWWRSLTLTERGIFGLWVDAAPDLVTAQDIVTTLGLKGVNSVRGHIRRFTQKAEAVGFQAGWQSSKRDPLTGQVLYGLRDFGTGEFPYDRLTLAAEDYAALLDRARTLVDKE